MAKGEEWVPVEERLIRWSLGATKRWTGHSVSRRKQRGKRCNVRQARTKRRPLMTLDW